MHYECFRKHVIHSVDYSLQMKMDDRGIVYMLYNVINKIKEDQLK